MYDIILLPPTLSWPWPTGAPAVPSVSGSPHSVWAPPPLDWPAWPSLSSCHSVHSESSQPRPGMLTMNSCNLCEYRTKDLPSLRHHIKSVHEGVRYFCSLCEHMALSQGQPTHNLKSDHEGIRYPCSTCEYKSTDKGKLNSHIQVKHNKGSQKFPCSQCEYEASTPASLWTHVRWHTQPYWCWSCERTWWGPRSGRPCPRRCSPASAWWPSELDEAALLIEKLFRSQFPPIPFIVLLH